MAIVDDIGAIVVVAFFYSSELHLAYLGCADAVIATLWFLNSTWSVDFAAAKVAVFAASVPSAVTGVAVLWHAGRNSDAT